MPDPLEIQTAYIYYISRKSLENDLAPKPPILGALSGAIADIGIFPIDRPQFDRIIYCCKKIKKY